MRIIFCVLIYVIGIYYQQCFGLNFIDLPGFGSDEKSEAALINIGQDDKTSSLLTEDFDLDKQTQKKEQSLEGRKFNGLLSKDQPVNSTSSSVATTTKTAEKATIKTRSESGPNEQPYPPVRPTQAVVTIPNYRRHWLVRNPPPDPTPMRGDEKDENIKSKITMLVQQTMHDTEARMKTVQKLKDKHRDEAPYRVGFILSMIKKSRDVLNELFNVAVKHRDEWKALEQLKIFELIVHTNVDTTNLVRQLVEIHIQNLNATAYPSAQKQDTTTTTTTRDPGEPEIPQFRKKKAKLL